MYELREWVLLHSTPPPSKCDEHLLHSFQTWDISLTSPHFQGHTHIHTHTHTHTQLLNSSKVSTNYLTLCQFIVCELLTLCSTDCTIQFSLPGLNRSIASLRVSLFTGLKECSEISSIFKFCLLSCCTGGWSGFVTDHSLFAERFQSHALP